MLPSDPGLLRQRLEGYRQVIAAETAAGAPDGDAVRDARRMRVVLFWVLGDSEACWREHQLCGELELRRARRQPGEAAAPQPWYGTPLAGQSLLVDFHRGGFGDLIQYARFAAGLARLDGPVTLLTRPELLRLFASCLGGGLTWIAAPSDAPRTDLAAGFPVLPVQLRWTLADVAASVPYLHPAAALRERWRQRLGGWRRPWIGLCWTRTTPDVRCVPLAACAPLLRHRQATFISLQKEAHGEEVRAAGCGETLVEFAGELGNFDDTAALMSNLDQVISIDTSLAHLAGALGKPTWLLLLHSTSDNWNIGPTRDSVHWYPTMRLFRQARQGRWDEALADLGTSLSGLLASFPR